ncbi:MAG TPA: glycosyltransferase family 2 protein [Chloroflexota bacterium]|jgi:glycosyltransferase involved in cell wall biosynthesis|nr:glycosyltransferase family 2 protein [Chloroflexota bacterium]
MSTGITVFFPCYGDAGTIASMVVLAERTVRELTDDWEIVVVDDCSPDHAGEVLEELRARYPRLRVVTHPANRGYGGALRSGFAAATKELVFYTDGDAQYDPRELPRLYARLTPDVDVVNGYKLFRGDGPVRALVGKIYHTVVSVAFGLRIRDVDCDFRLIRRSALEGIELASTSGTICVELIRKLQDRGARFAEVGVNHYDRPFGSSQFFRPKRLILTLGQLGALWWRLVVRPERGVVAVETPATEP